ncbi:uncharacterized protein LOC143803899 [Ranitomeya variabilis]|uniref:uncharacterized protein LOC143803899 n=1 Tax=Ranitomeya variabilis TaxID=490064 RepID=UPI004057712A
MKLLPKAEPATLRKDKEEKTNTISLYTSWESVLYDGCVCTKNVLLCCRCRIVREAAAAAACLRFFLLSRSLRSPRLLGPPQKNRQNQQRLWHTEDTRGRRFLAVCRLHNCQCPSQRAKKKKRIVVDEEPLTIHNETLINLVEANPSIWDQRDSSHHDIVKNRKLWDQIISHFDPRYMEKSSTSKKKIADAVHTRWKSIRDRFVRDYRNSQNPPSGSGAKRVTPYVHYEQLLFLQKTVSQRSTICSTAAPRQAEELEPSPLEPSQQTGTEDVSVISEPRSGERSTVALGVSAR